MAPEPDNEQEIDIEANFNEGTPIEEALNRGVREAVLLHRRLGLPMAVWPTTEWSGSIPTIPMMGLPVQALTAKSRKSLKCSKPGVNRQRETCYAPGPSGCYWPSRSLACLIRISSADTRLRFSFAPWREIHPYLCVSLP